MTIERIEVFAIFKFVLKNDSWAIIFVDIVVMDATNNTISKRINWCFSFDAKVNSKMHTAIDRSIVTFNLGQL